MVPYRFIFAFPLQHNWFRAAVKDEIGRCSIPDWRQDTVWCLSSFINGRVYALCETEACEGPLMLPFRLIFIIIIIWRGKFWNNPVFCLNLVYLTNVNYFSGICKKRLSTCIIRLTSQIGSIYLMRSEGTLNLNLSPSCWPSHAESETGAMKM